LYDWCYKNERFLRRNWEKDLLKGKIRLYWCCKGIKGPRIFSYAGPAFEEDCKFFEG